MNVNNNCLAILACPDCGGKLRGITETKLLGFVCSTCQLVFPIVDGIVIILGRQVRNRQLERDLVSALIPAAKGSLRWLQPYIDKTLRLLDQRQDATPWEWEDEEFWTESYNIEAIAKSRKNWNDRIWQRECLVRVLLRDTSLKDKLILDVGSGEGQNFRLLLSDYSDASTLYIATDISLSGLKLNQARNNSHANSMYILCSADCLPIQAEKVDLLCYFGILHHTSRKINNLQQQIQQVKSNGYIILHESISRPTFSLVGFTWRHQSAHEGHIQLKELDSIISSNRLKVLVSRPQNTIFYTGIIKLFGGLLMRSRPLFSFVSGVDIVLMKLLGPVIPYFKPGEINLLLKKSS